MPEIIHLAPGQKPEFERPRTIFEWKAGGEIEVSDNSGIGRWQVLPPEWINRYVESADRRANEMGYKRVYIIG